MDSRYRSLMASEVTRSTSRSLGISYANIADRIGVNLWMAKRAARWGNIQKA